jgi:hypothetical protein
MHTRVVTPPYIRINICWTDIGHALIQQYAAAASAASELNVKTNAAAGVYVNVSMCRSTSCSLWVFLSVCACVCAAACARVCLCVYGCVRAM